MKEVVASLFLLAGATFMLLSAVGVVRFPDLFMRMQSTTKAATLGAVCVFLGVAVVFSQVDVTARTLLVLAFVFITTPVAAHLIARAAHVSNIPLWRGTLVDEYAEVVPGRDPDGPRV